MDITYYNTTALVDVIFYSSSLLSQQTLYVTSVNERK